MVIHRENTAWGKTSIVVVCDGLGVAMVSRVNSEPDFATVHNLSIHKTAKGKGIGNALLDLVEREAAGMGVDRVRISTDSHDWKLVWYKRRGYKKAWKGIFEWHSCTIVEKEIRRETIEPQSHMLVRDSV